MKFAIVSPTLKAEESFASLIEKLPSMLPFKIIRTTGTPSIEKNAFDVVVHPNLVAFDNAINTALQGNHFNREHTSTVGRLYDLILINDAEDSAQWANRAVAIADSHPRVFVLKGTDTERLDRFKVITKNLFDINYNDE